MHRWPARSRLGRQPLSWRVLCATFFGTALMILTTAALAARADPNRPGMRLRVSSEDVTTSSGSHMILYTRVSGFGCAWWSAGRHHRTRAQILKFRTEPRPGEMDLGPEGHSVVPRWAFDGPLKPLWDGTAPVGALGVMAIGFPFHCLWCEVVHSTPAGAGAPVIDAVGGFKVLDRPSRPFGPRAMPIMLPLRPRYAHLALNLLFFITSAFLTQSLFIRIRGVYRSHRGLCPACTYDLRATPAGSPCPECGYISILRRPPASRL